MKKQSSAPKPRRARRAAKPKQGLDPLFAIVADNLAKLNLSEVVSAQLKGAMEAASANPGSNPLLREAYADLFSAAFLVASNEGAPRLSVVREADRLRHLARYLKVSGTSAMLTPEYQARALWTLLQKGRQALTPSGDAAVNKFFALVAESWTNTTS